MTIATQLVLRAFLTEPSKELYGLEICNLTGLQPGSTHAILARFERNGWLDTWREEVDPSAVGRPSRRYYKLNPDGAQKARAALREVGEKSPLGRLLPGFAGLAGQG